MSNNISIWKIFNLLLILYKKCLISNQIMLLAYLEPVEKLWRVIIFKAKFIWIISYISSWTTALKLHLSNNSQFWASTKVRTFLTLLEKIATLNKIFLTILNNLCLSLTRYYNLQYLWYWINKVNCVFKILFSSTRSVLRRILILKNLF